MDLRLLLKGAPDGHDFYGNQYTGGGGASKEEVSQAAAAAKKEIEAVGTTQANSFGFCGVVSVGVWDKMGQPKDLVPTSVMVGEEEHVVLMNRKADPPYVIDPTGGQFDLPFVTTGKGKLTERYKKPVKLTTADLGTLREERAAAQSRYKDKKARKKPAASKPAVGWWSNGGL